MKDFKEKYNALDNVSKSAINAYRSGRQFMVTGINTAGIGIMINKRLYPTIIASIVNEVFACELFFKSMIIIKTGKKKIEGHKLFELFNLLDNKKIEDKLLDYNFIEELQKISNAFVDWRYCYEYNTMTINRGFVFDLCKVLEIESKILILKEYNLNMDQSFI